MKFKSLEDPESVMRDLTEKIFTEVIMWGESIVRVYRGPDGEIEIELISNRVGREFLND